MDIWKELKQEGVDSGLLEEVRAFRDAHPAPPEAAGRVPVSYTHLTLPTT